MRISVGPHLLSPFPSLCLVTFFFIISDSVLSWIFFFFFWTLLLLGTKVRRLRRMRLKEWREETMERSRVSVKWAWEWWVREDGSRGWKGGQEESASSRDLTGDIDSCFNWNRNECFLALDSVCCLDSSGRIMQLFFFSSWYSYYIVLSGWGVGTSLFTYWNLHLQLNKVSSSLHVWHSERF